MAATPEVLWAQRSNKTDAAKNFIYLTITVPDVQASKLKLDLTPTSLSFAGHSDSLKRDYALELEFYAEIDKAESKINHTAKNIELVLRKKELKEEFWPRLLKDAKKVHFLKTDFDKWVDEDEQDEAPEDDLAGNMGGMGGMPGMGDMSSMMGGAGGDFGGIDFSKLGGAGMGGEGEGEEEDEDDDDEDMPELEEEEETGKADAKSSSKIEEIN
ncbi:Protein wos2 [Lachnellula suecica]|uniref:Protein wos2 n=1 Tax=Lachnellula suecica TaxID=602035 RepID=A0A8T9C007_9HELO|nr:Protein wos2 [Lachnellula suecica]